MSEVLTELRGCAGLITLNRPRALNALSLPMIRELTRVLLAWQDDPAVAVVAIRGTGREGLFGAFCAGGDVRFFHQAVLAGDPALGDFFTEEYRLNHLIHRLRKPYVAFLDGIVMGGGMGITQCASLRIVTERTRMAMPETAIGLFPDVGGGFFLSRCPGRVGEYLALTGQVIGGADAVAVGLADLLLPAARMPDVWDALAGPDPQGELARMSAEARARREAVGAGADLAQQRTAIDSCFGLESVGAIVQALESDGTPWAAETAAVLRKRSPLMLHVVLEQLRRGRAMTLADDLRMERDLVHQCFHLRPGRSSETFEGIRAAVIDKDHRPAWNPARIEDVTPAMVAAFFNSPWPAGAHPLGALGTAGQAAGEG